MGKDMTNISEERGDGYGPLQFMAVADGWVMYRRPGREPNVERQAQWERRPLEADVRPWREKWEAAHFSSPKTQEKSRAKPS